MAVLRNSRRRTGIALATATVLVLGGAALPAAASSGPAEGVIANAGSEDTISDSYLVVLADVSASSGKSRELARKYDADITSTFKHALNGFAAEVNERQAKRLAADPAVKEVVQNERVELAATQAPTPSWGLDRIDQVSLPLDNSYTYPTHGGQGVTAYIIDTGVRYTHNDFGGRVTFGFDAFGGNGSDGNGHGTHVAGTVAGTAYGVAKNADIVAVRVLNNQGSGTIESVVGGVDWVTGNASGPSVANMSLGGGANSVLDQAVRNSIASGVTYAVAAGNNFGSDASGTSPARVAEAITVASTDRNDSRSSFSNVGSVVDIFAPGGGITSAWHTGDSAANTISGTSMATPHVAGAAALHLAENPGHSPAQVWAALDAASVPGKVGNPLSAPNKLLHIGEGGGPIDPPDGQRFENTTTVPIRDHQTSESPIDVSGIATGEVPANLQVEVDISHTWRGDLTIDLIAPDGTSWRLKAASGGDSADDVRETYTVDGSGVQGPSGRWILRVHDGATFDQGQINSWALQF